jgi:ppGpp synthetase/RelA/SpoT-type nucleotidyltranferase
MAFDRKKAQAAYDARVRIYKRANEEITFVLDALLDDLSKRYGVREGLYVMGEPKSFESFYRKAKKYRCKSVEEAFKRVRDLSRVRVVCTTLDDCYQLLELLRGQRALYVDESKIEDYIAKSSPTGYRAIHLEVTVDVIDSGSKVGVPVEVQIRSTLQEAWGHYTHADFYHADAVPEHVGTLMRELSDLLFWADRHASNLVGEVSRVRGQRAGGA